MKKLTMLTALGLIASGSALADVWKWVDANGKTHFVDSDKSIFTWRDESGRVFYSDKKDHDDAVLVQLVWHSSGTLDDLTAKAGESADADDGEAYPGETAEDRAARESAEAYYCKRATEIHDAYVNAPKLYRTGEDGEKVYLDDAEAKQTIEDARTKVAELCK